MGVKKFTQPFLEKRRREGWASRMQCKNGKTMASFTKQQA